MPKEKNNRELIFRERIEMISLLTAIKNQTTDKAVKEQITFYFKNKSGLYEELKKAIPYHYRVISPQLYDKLVIVPEDLITLEDTIQFLLEFYYKNRNLSKAQEILTEETALEKIEKDCNNNG